MKILSWNCNGKFREKFKEIQTLDPDIWLIQECEDPRNVDLKHKDYHDFCGNFLWTGENRSKGIAVFAKSSILLKRIELDLAFRGRSLKWFLGVYANDLKLLCVWNHKNSCGSFDYIGQFWQMLQSNREIIRDTIVLGDFNSNSIWDEWDRWWNHTDCIRELSEINTLSLYHEVFKESQGCETRPTFYLQKNQQKAYHIDYAFMPINKIECSTLKVGSFEQWIKFSDHMPLICEIQSRNSHI